MSERRYWLLKSEPETYGIDHLARDRRTRWDGVRNYRARNFLRDQMHVGDGVLFYHSSCEPPGVAGIARVCSEPYPDPTQFDPKSPYHDPDSKREEPRWFVVDVEVVRKLDELLPLAFLREQKALDGMALLQKGQRLSVQPVKPAEWRHVLKLAGLAGRELE
jgi:predicted RNA-binding protein with PUA-like domain